MKNVLIKLNKIRAEIKVGKEKNEKLKYKAFTVAGLNAELNSLLIANNLGVNVATHLDGCLPTNKKWGEAKDRYSNEVYNYERESFYVSGSMKITIVDLDGKSIDPADDILEAEVPLVGMNSEGDPSKSLGSAMSYGYKYFWITQLGLTDETLDVDSNAHSATKAPAAPEIKQPSKEERDAFKAQLEGAMTVIGIKKHESDFLKKYQLSDAMKTALEGLVKQHIERISNG